MITGDHPLTARQIAHELGISANGRILTGQELAPHVRAGPGRRGRGRLGLRPGVARAQAEHRAGAAEPRPRRRDDRRRRQRRAGAQAGRHRRRDGHHRHGRLERSVRDGAAERQLHDHRRGGRRRPRHLRQHPQVHPLLAGGQPGQGVRGAGRAAAGHAAAVRALPNPVDEPRDRRRARPGHERGAGRARRHETPAASARRRRLRPGPGPADHLDGPPDRPGHAGRRLLGLEHRAGRLADDDPHHRDLRAGRAGPRGPFEPANRSSG